MRVHVIYIVTPVLILMLESLENINMHYEVYTLTTSRLMQCYQPCILLLEWTTV
jgi:hypothetical protein